MCILKSCFGFWFRKPFLVAISITDPLKLWSWCCLNFKQFREASASMKLPSKRKSWKEWVVVSLHCIVPISTCCVHSWEKPLVLLIDLISSRRKSTASRFHPVGIRSMCSRFLCPKPRVLLLLVQWKALRYLTLHCLLCVTPQWTGDAEKAICKPGDGDISGNAPQSAASAALAIAVFWRKKLFSDIPIHSRLSGAHA